MAFFASSSIDIPSASLMIFSTSERSASSVFAASVASVAASLPAAAVSPPVAAVVAVVVPPPPHPARDIAAMETASANDKVRFLIKLFLLHLIGSFCFSHDSFCTFIIAVRRKI